MLKQKWGAAIIAVAMAASSAAFGGTDAQQNTAAQHSTLAPGKAAGVQKAQMMGTNTALLIAGGVIVVGGIALAVSNSGNGSSNATTSTVSP